MQILGANKSISEEECCLLIQTLWETHILGYDNVLVRETNICSLGKTVKQTFLAIDLQNCSYMENSTLIFQMESSNIIMLQVKHFMK
jgi:hypothetical protein